MPRVRDSGASEGKREVEMNQSVESSRGQVTVVQVTEELLEFLCDLQDPQETAPWSTSGKEEEMKMKMKVEERETTLRVLQKSFHDLANELLIAP